MTKTLPLASLVEDFALYPRNRVDDSHVADLVRALQAGQDLPHIVVDAKSRRIVDGVHRRRAMLKHFGEDAAVAVDVRKYADDTALFLDAVALNAQHGRKLDRHDQTRIVLRLRELNVADTVIASTLHVPEPQIQTLAIRVVYEPSGQAMPAKRGLRHLYGQPVTVEQVQTIRSVRSAEAGRLCLELTKLLETNLIDLSDERIVQQLRALSESIDKSLRSLAA